MSEIEIGEYVRTKMGKIGKVCAYEDLIVYDDKEKSATFHSFDSDKGSIADVEVSKHSKNIIDLITREDYVNGKKVIDILTNKINGAKLIITGDLEYKCKTAQEYIETEGISILGNDDIKSIVTKEQYKNIEYKVGK